MVGGREGFLLIKDIDWKYYPREEPNQRQIDLYRQALNNLPPILVSKDGFGIDGKHRCEAYRQEGKSEIPAEVLEIEEDGVLVESIKRNATHGLQLSNSDKKRNAVLLYEAELSVDEIEQLLSVHRNSVLNWTEDARKEKRTEEDRIIWGMWLACATTRAIADVLDLTHGTIQNRLDSLHKNVRNIQPTPLKTFNLWSFPKCDNNYGFKYPGRIPGQIIEHLLYYYTEPFDVVWDLFGGSGTTIDVCKLMARRYRVYDIEPARDGIVKCDVTTGLPADRPRPKLIFLDPPYWKQKRGEYGKQETNLANMELSDFYDVITSVLKECIKKADVTALIIGGTQDGANIIDHSARIMNAIGVPKQRIIVPYPTEQYTGAQVKRAKENKTMLNLHRDLMIWQSQKNSTKD